MLVLMSGAVGAPILLDNPATTTIGPGFLGNAFNWLFLGTLLMQFYIYWQNYPADTRIIKLLVYIIVVMELAQTAFGTHESWWYAVGNWGNLQALQTAPWTALVRPIMCGIIAAVVKLFYAFRIWRLRRSILTCALVVLIIMLALTQGCAVIVSVALIDEDLSQQNFIHLHPVFMASVWLAGSFTTDLLISGSMIWILQTSKSRSLVTPTNSLLNRLIVNTIQTGSATVVCAGIGLALFVKYTDKNYYYAFVYVLGKIYSNSFLATLNFRVNRKPVEIPGMRIQNQMDMGFVPSNPLAQKNDLLADEYA
ncbi:hypothetical protein C8F04DRAFT_1297068 [Mycena alexandri]|uniref:DUF6534 domain-containing protein n=1 Tax=Mycena alexandri TaxID=1745969 RepID=A0AAD6T9J4_9AGAR|nr:hypothetical protein C8F04DRAFT_1297068 [Mycena alexandri]